MGQGGGLSHENVTGGNSGCLSTTPLLRGGGKIEPIIKYLYTRTLGQGMVPSLEPGIEDRLKSPDVGNEIRIIVGVESAGGEAEELLVSTGAEVDDILPLDYYAVSTTEEQLEEICDLGIVTSVSLDSEGSVFDSDFLSHPG